MPLDPTAIEYLHADPADYVGLIRKVNDRTHPVGSVQVKDLRRMLPGIARFMEQDSYITLNGYYRSAPWVVKETGLPAIWRKERFVHSLTACYVDIDCGRLEGGAAAMMDSWDALAVLGRLGQAGIIPPPSIIGFSGRGLYAFWALRDKKDASKNPGAYPEKVALYKRINREFVRRLDVQGLAADPAAIDAARVLRFPGSIHTKAAQEVRWVIQLDDAGEGFLYSLEGLAEFLGVPVAGDLPDGMRTPDLPHYRRKTRDKGSCPNRKAGPKALAAVRAQDVLTIAQNRPVQRRLTPYADGAVSCGRRNVCALYAQFLFSAGLAEKEAAVRVGELAASMDPPYPSDGPAEDPPVTEIVHGVWADGRNRSWGTEKLCRMLGVSPDLAREWNLRTIIPEVVRQEREDARPTLESLIQRRRDWLERYIHDHYGVPPACRKLAELYKAEGFRGANPQTAATDLQSLGFKSPVKGKPKVAPLPFSE